MSVLDDDLAPLWQALHIRYGQSTDEVVSVTATLDHRGLVALAELLREPKVRRSPVRNLKVAKVAAALGVGVDQLRDKVEARLGPTGNRRAERDRQASARQDAREQLTEAAGDDQALATWASAQAVGTGEILDERVADALAVVGLLREVRPDPVPLPVVAAERFGDPHAIDADRSLGRMLTAAVVRRAGLETADATTRRRLLREVGIVADELSSTVLTYRLPLADGHPLAHAGAGEAPSAFTLAQMLQAPPRFAPGLRRVRVVENPAVLSAASLRGSEIAWVCTSGVPSVAALELVVALVAAGVSVEAHADFDAAGLAIVDQLVTRGAVPWQMDVEHYRLAATASRVALVEDPAEVPWAPGLAAQMRACGRVGFEEHLLEQILDAPTSQ